MSFHVSIFFVLSFLFFFSCSTPEKKQMKVEGKTQGTTFFVLYLSEEEKDYSREIDSLLKAFDYSLSAWNENSILTKVNRNDTTVVADEFFKTVFIRSMQIAELSDGAFDPTVAPLVNAYGFGFKNKSKTDSATIDSLKKLVNYKNISLDENGKIKKQDSRMELDFNAIAQGYSVDVLAGFLEKNGIENYLIEIGGETRAKGKNANGKLWKIGIDKPLENAEEREIQTIIFLENKSLATSGNYRKFYEENGVKYSHTINPKTGYPVRHSLLSATVVADNCMDADAYATVFMVIGLEEAQKFLSTHNELQALLIYSGENGELKMFATDELKKRMK